MRAHVIEEVVAGAGPRAEREDHAWRALAFLSAITWLGEGTGGRVVFETWFRHHLHGEGLQASLRLLNCIHRDVRVELVWHVLEAEGRLHGQWHQFVAEAGRMLAKWSLWWEQGFARDRVQRLFAAAVRPGALASAEAWRSFLSGFAWSLQNQVRHVVPQPGVEPGLARFVPLLELAWSAWSATIDEVADRNALVGWAVTALLARDSETKIEPPAGGWSTSLRHLLLRVICEGGRDDIFGFQQVDWTVVDPETLAMIANVTIIRADREITSRPATDLLIDGLIEILAQIGRLPTLALVDARRVLDCLQRLGRGAQRAISAAIRIEREVRAREKPPDR
jgi:hypothetical protein